MPLCPESPKYNLINKGRTEQAEKDLKKLRDRDDVGAELDVIKDEANTARTQPKVTFGEMFRGALRWPLFIAVMMMFSQQVRPYLGFLFTVLIENSLGCDNFSAGLGSQNPKKRQFLENNIILTKEKPLDGNSPKIRKKNNTVTQFLGKNKEVGVFLPKTIFRKINSGFQREINFSTSNNIRALL